MRQVSTRTFLTAIFLGAFAGSVCASGCGSSGGGKGGKAGADGAAGGAAAGAAGADAAVGDGGTGGTTAGTGGVDAAGEVSAEASSPDGPSDAAMDAPVDVDGAPGDALAEVLPSFDAGSDCVAPSGETPLSAAAAGLPSTGLALWLRGDRGIYKTAAQGVCAWADQSGHGTILTGTGVRPAWTSNGLGGQPAVHFMAAGQQLGTSGVLGIAPTSARTIVAVLSLIATTQRFEAVFQGQSGTPGTYLGFDANTFGTVGNREGVYMMNNAYDSALATSSAPRIHVYTIPTMTPGAPILPGIDYRVNGATQALTRRPVGLGNGNFEDFSQANFTSVGSLAEGIIAEVLVYDRALTVDERGAVETALKTRYAIP
jgi:hypothetical protein